MKHLKGPITKIKIKNVKIRIPNKRVNMKLNNSNIARYVFIVLTKKANSIKITKHIENLCNCLFSILDPYSKFSLDIYNIPIE